MPNEEAAKPQPACCLHDRLPLRIRQTHTPHRPLWLCRRCGHPWPCADARLLLRAEYRGNLVSLSMYLVTLMHEAAEDLHKLNPNPGVDALRLWERFCGWARPRVCPCLNRCDTAP